MRVPIRRSILLIAATLLALSGIACQRVSAAPLVVILADRIGLNDVTSPSDGILSATDLQGAVVALVSPGLPNHKAGGAYANLYATLSAGDVVDTGNVNSGLLQRDLYIGSLPGAVRLIQFGDASTSENKARLHALIDSLRAQPSDGNRAPGILLVGVQPVSDRDCGLKSESWDDLTPIVWLSCGDGGSDGSEQPTLTSDTTQTPGLIALRDIARR